MINSRMDVQNVLSQMRQVRAQMQVQNQPQPVPNPVQSQMKGIEQTNGSLDAQMGMPSVQGNAPVQSSENAPRFGEMFKSAIDTVNASQKTANTMRTAYEQGVPGVDLPDVMIAANKSKITFEATTQVRNRLLEAYKEIMNMPV
ncbi:MAG: flagellar hook-basal body complex protein FliE [Natronospirillum sp.]